MFSRFNDVAWRQVLPRVTADLAIVHAAALLSLAVAALWQLGEVPGLAAAALFEDLRTIYLTTFVPLSLLFPAVFGVGGVYTWARLYQARYKWTHLARMASLATLLFLFGAFLISQAAALPRSAILVFIVLVNAMTIAMRMAKNWVSEPLPAAAPVSATDPAGAPVLVVGGAGYIGSMLCRKLLARGYRVRLFDSFVYGDAAVRDLFGHPRFEVSVGDCRNIQNVVAAMNGAGSVVHLAAIVGDPACEQDRRAASEINYAATRMMTEIARGHGVRRFVFASSCSVYGETEELVDEHSALHPISLYAQTKVDSERALLAARTETFEPVVLRLATVFGNSFRPRFDLVVNLLTAKALRDGVITIFNGSQWRPFIHVSDVAEGFLAALDAPAGMVSGEIFNLGDSRLNYTLSDVAATIQRVVPEVRVEHIENPDRRNYRVSFDKIRDRLAFHSKVTLEEGVADLRAALTSGRIADYTDAAYHNQRFLKAAGRLISKEEIDSQVMAAFAMALANQSDGVREPELQPR